jgi:chromate transporter
VLFFLDVHPLLVVLAAACAGLLLVKLSTNQVEKHPAAPSSTWKFVLGILTIYGLALLILYLVRRDLFDLSLLLFRIDLTAFGGGFASVPLMYHEIVNVHGWLDSQTLMDGIALGQITPGPIVITATFVGYLVAGLVGGVVATISIFLPSFLMVTGIAPYFERLRSSVLFQKAVAGVLCGFVGLLASVTLKFGLDIHWDLAHALLSLASLVALLLKVDILWVFLAGTTLSIFLFR